MLFILSRTELSAICDKEISPEANTAIQGAALRTRLE
jgi:hypothetical protein